jgi:uncharacterized protein (TIGR02145 family)
MGLVISEWEDFGYRGHDAGTNLKTTSGWNENGNGTDLFGFSGLPGGYRYNGQFFQIGSMDSGGHRRSTIATLLGADTSITIVREFIGTAFPKYTVIVFVVCGIIPCPGTPTVEYEGQVYNTIQIFSQCWLKENLNVGVMIPGTMEQSNNGTIEKYCYNNEPDSCAKYGGLYQWNEMMQYTTQQGAQGICPPGWHLPTDEEWKVLEGAVDSLYWIGDGTWDDLGWRGYDAGMNLKTTSGWNDGGNGTDVYGFSSLPGGYRNSSGSFNAIGNGCLSWTSSPSINYLWNRYLAGHSREVFRYTRINVSGYSVRCLKDN